jgi:hypothetical protein
MTWLLYAGIGLAAILAALAAPYLVGYLIHLVTG